LTVSGSGSLSFLPRSRSTTLPAADSMSMGSSERCRPELKWARTCRPPALNVWAHHRRRSNGVSGGHHPDRRFQRSLGQCERQPARLFGLDIGYTSSSQSWRTQQHSTPRQQIAFHHERYRRGTYSLCCPPHTSTITVTLESSTQAVVIGREHLTPSLTGGQRRQPVAIKSSLLPADRRT